MPNIGPLELVIVLVIVLVIFGPKRLPGLGRSLGSGMREFKDSVTGKDKDEERQQLEADARARGETEGRKRGRPPDGRRAPRRAADADRRIARVVRGRPRSLLL